MNGRANAEVERFLAGTLGLGRGRVSVVGGASSRDETVFVEGLGAEEVLGALLPPGAHA